MPLPAVLVEISPADAPPALVSTLLDACSDALRSAECVRSDHAAGRNAWGIAIVSWRDAAQTRVWVEVGRHGAQRASWHSREVRFNQADAPVERWRTVGFTVATLAEQADPGALGDTAEDPNDEPIPPVDRDAAPSAEAVESVPASLWLSAGPLAGSGLDGGSWRWGGWTRAVFVPTRLHLYGTSAARLSFATSDESTTARWLSLTLGLGIFALVSPFRVDLSGELLVDSVSASATDPETGTESRAARWVSGICLGTRAAWPATGPVGVTAGAELCRSQDGKDLPLLDGRAAVFPGLYWTVLAGAEWRLR